MRAARREKVETMHPVCIYTAHDRREAEMLLEALQRNHIQGLREAEGGGSAGDQHAGNPAFGEKIFVDMRDAERAERIIASICTETEIAAEPDDEIEEKKSKVPGWFQVSAVLVVMFVIVGIIANLIM